MADQCQRRSVLHGCLPESRSKRSHRRIRASVEERTSPEDCMIRLIDSAQDLPDGDADVTQLAREAIEVLRMRFSEDRMGFVKRLFPKEEI
jgi:hypothetical protein